ncbi:PIG-L deacetylase family protein [Streptomyces varsoviensis]|uniref:LmbE family protein n=1 Tax=Streptomyces varsoviensis TaxID=67373 RepID=A0ABR5JDG9_9ACTN|nr:PIG-L family deacetylase [Streptomyces varsoviensis]KOG91469.1 LmbE family protein [Streptomyces varsoviensis]
MPSPWTTVVISPHFDDAALSLAGFLRRVDGPAAVATVHAGAAPADRELSYWDSVCGFVSTAEAHRTRLAEDARACALMRVDQVLLDHPDGPYRDSEPLTALTDFLAGLPLATRVLLPLGTNQRDHRAVRDQGLAALASRPGADAATTPRPWVYADLPYSGASDQWGTDQASAALEHSDRGDAYRDLKSRYRLDVIQDLHLTDEEWIAKREAVICYTSQLAPVAVDHKAFLRRPGPLQSELIWELT